MAWPKRFTTGRVKYEALSQEWKHFHRFRDRPVNNVGQILRVFPRPGQISRGSVQFEANVYPCALGKGGIRPAPLKVEGDHATPAGIFYGTRLFFRPDRFTGVECAIPQTPLSSTSGWCDDPESPDYNRPVTLPQAARCESLWRDDHVYDLILVISHNYQPTVPGRGSAIFFHLSDDALDPTEGCIAIKEKDFLKILKTLTPKTLIRIHHSRD